MEGDEEEDDDDSEGGDETACEDVVEKYAAGKTAEGAEQSRKSRMSSGDGQSSSAMGGLMESACACAFAWACG